jgi:hypothetical protein
MFRRWYWFASMIAATVAATRVTAIGQTPRVWPANTTKFDRSIVRTVDHGPPRCRIWRELVTA